jgi:diaminopimelate epimerase
VAAHQVDWGTALRGTILYKMTGSGNDFVMLDGRCVEPDFWSQERIAAVCDRRTGVGADGLVILTPEGPDAVRMVYWNSDGSRAAICGNAALCSARLSVYLEMVPDGDLRLLTDAGEVPARSGTSGDAAEINLPDFDMPVAVPELEPVAGERWLGFATVGVPHVVVRVDDIEAVDVVGRGRALRYAPALGPAGANVNFVAPSQMGRWLIRTYERGVEAETLACGTGTVAAALALACQKEVQLPVRFRTRGGPELAVRATIERSHARNVWLGGQGKLVFRAIWEV